MKRTLLAAAILAASAAAPAAFAQTSDWTGLYVGGQLGHPFKADDEIVVFDTDRDGVFDDTVLTSTGGNAFAPGFCDGGAMGPSIANGCRKGDGDINYSVRVGYDLQLFGNWVVGILAEESAVNIGDDVSAFSSVPAASYTFTRDLRTLTSVRARGGWATNDALLYATAGWAWGDIDQSFTTTNTVNTFQQSMESEINGYQLGVGYEHKLGDVWLIGSGWTVGLEYLWTSLDEGEHPVAVGPGTAPANNPFIIIDPTGTDMRRTKDIFEYSTIGVSLNWRLL